MKHRPALQDEPANARTDQSRTTPTLPAVRAGAAPLLTLQRLAGNRAVSQVVARQVDPGLAPEIKRELDSWIPFNNRLEASWSKLGAQLPEAIETPAYKELWRLSVEKEKIDQVAASRGLIAAFGADTISFARSRLSSQATRLENLVEDLRKAKEENQSRAQPNQSSVGGVQDETQRMSRVTMPKPLADAGSLVDAATVVDFLENWPQILRSAQVGMRRVDTSVLKPPGPAPQQPPILLPGPAGGDAARGVGDDQGPGEDLSPVLFDPNATDEQMRASGAEIDDDTLRALREAHRQCAENNVMFKELAQAMLAEDANLAILHERQELKNISALSGQSDSVARDSIVRVAEQNATDAKKFLKLLATQGAVDWRILTPIVGHLRKGGDGGRRNWSDPGATRFVDMHFARVTEAENAKARAEAALVVANLVAMLALLTPAAPAAAAFLAVMDVHAAASAIADSAAADKRADVTAAGAAAQVVDKDAASAAREDANAKRASMVVSIMTSALPYLPSMAKGVGRAGSMLGKAKWVSLAASTSRGGRAGQRGAASMDLLVDLATFGVSAIARNRVQGVLALSAMARRIQAINRTLSWSRVAAATARGGDEGLLHLGSKYGLSDYIRYHIHGPGLGRERYPIFLAPERANQFANNHIEGFMRREFKSGATVDFSVSYSTFSGEEMSGFIRNMLLSGDQKILTRLALDRGLIEKFLKSATYDIRVTRAGSTQLYRANVTVGPPGSGVMTLSRPGRIP